MDGGTTVALIQRISSVHLMSLTTIEKCALGATGPNV